VHKTKFTIGLIIILILAFIQKSNSQCRQYNKVFDFGEKLEYSVSYNWGILYVEAGSVSFEVSDTIYNGKKSYLFKSFGNSLDTYDWFFRVRDTWQSICDTSKIKPYWFNRNSFEGSYWANNTYSYDYQAKKIYSWSANSNKTLERDTFQLKNCLFDLMTGLYYFRNLDFTKYKINDKINLSFIIDNEVYPNLYARYLGKEKITLSSGKTYECFKLSPYLVKGTIFKGGEGMKVWISTDGKNIPILIEAEILIGFIKAELRSKT